MNSQKNTLFNYVKLLTDIQRELKKSQEELSMDLDCTASHISNVKNGKSTFSFDRAMQLVNKYERCIEDYLKIENSITRRMEKEYNEWKQDIDIELQLLVLEQIKIMMKYKHKKKEEQSVLTGEERRKKISENIKRIRIKKGISVRKMCKSLNMNKSTYRNIENTSNKTTMDNYAHIAEILDVPLTLLLKEGLKNRKALVQYQLEKTVSMMNFVEKREMKKMMEEIAGILKKYKKW